MQSVTRLISMAVLMLPLMSATAIAQTIDVTWGLGVTTELDKTVAVVGDEAYTSLVTPSFTLGPNLEAVGLLSTVASELDTMSHSVGLPAFTKIQPKVKVSAASPAHAISFSVTVPEGHTFKPLFVEFDAARCGTDKGDVRVNHTATDGTSKILATLISPMRNKITSSNPSGYSHHELTVSDCIIDGGTFTVTIYIMNVDNNKQLALRNIRIRGRVDEKLFTLGDLLESFTCSKGDLLPFVKTLTNGLEAKWSEKLMGDPTDFAVVAKDGYVASVNYSAKVATVTVQKNGEEVMSASLRFIVSSLKPHGVATPLNRGLLAVKKQSGVLVTWRVRKTDPEDVSFRLYRNGNLITSKPIRASSSYSDGSGAATSIYKLEVLDGDGNVIDVQDSVKAWANTYLIIPTETPEDERGTGATYTPNDATVCDMDGDGEYEIVLKWDPSNSKDAASSGVTGSTYIDCYKLDGTKLWRINLGRNIRSGAHTTPFLCYDFDQDGFGELIVKTAPGTIDGDGNYVVMGDDDPMASYIASNGHIMSGPEYLTVFDGPTGAEVVTVKYHTDYAAGASYWGDSNANRSDRYLACMAYLDGKHPSAVFARGYYRGAFVGAYDYDGKDLKLRWLHQSLKSGAELWGEGAHSVTVADVDFDGKDEITYGSAALDDDGTLLYRTGLHHGDALHTGDFDPDHEGLETYMVHEESPYGYDLRDAATGKFLVHVTASGDTGRGLIGDFDDQHDGSEFMASCSAYLYDCKGRIISKWQEGTVSSSSINFRVYWDGDVFDEYNDRGHCDKWDSDTKSWGRLITYYSNGSTTINGTKNNPNVQADFLGDWREEVVFYRTDDNALIVNTTDIPSYYKIPFLMDDRQYEESIVWQNVAYNQPPHLSYDLAAYCAKSLPTEYKNSDSEGYGWGIYYATTPMRVPAGAKAFYLTNLKPAQKQAAIVEVRNGIIVPGQAFLYYGKGDVVFRPAATPSSTEVANLLSGTEVAKTVKSGRSRKTYALQEGEHGVGLYFVDSVAVEPNGGYLQIMGSEIESDYYLLPGVEISNSLPSVFADMAENRRGIYTLQGVRISRTTKRGLYVVNGVLKLCEAGEQVVETE